MYGFVSVISGMSVIWSIMAISVERAIVVRSIIRLRDHRITTSRMRVVVAAIWLSALLLACPPLLGCNRYVYEVIFQHNPDYLLHY